MAISGRPEMQDFAGAPPPSITVRPLIFVACRSRTPYPGIFGPLYTISKFLNLSAIRTRKVGEVVYQELIMILVLQYLSKEAKIITELDVSAPE